MRTRDFRNRNDGFTLIELLVAVLIIGMLAAIALPAFLNQRQKAHDGDAKHNARALASLMAACYEESDGYVGCAVVVPLTEAGLPIGAGPGFTRVIAESATGYTIEAISRARTGATHHRFTLRSEVSGLNLRRCAPLGVGGCQTPSAVPAIGEW